MKNALVFGGTGFIGSHVVEQLILAGYAVTTPVRSTSDTAFLAGIGSRLVSIDFSDDVALRDCLQGQVLVFNCIANTAVHQSLERHRAVDVVLTKRLTEAAAKAGVHRFVQLSTVQVYGFSRPPIAVDEDFPCAPAHNYCRVALEREQVVRAVAHDAGMELVILRPVNTMGRRDSSMQAIFAGHRQGVVVIFGDGRNRWSWIDTRDVGRAMVWLGELAGAAGNTYLVKAGDTDWREIQRALDSARGQSSRLLAVPRAVAKPIAALLEAIVPYSKNLSITRFAVDVMSSQTLFDDSRIRATGYRTIYPLQEMIDECVRR